VTTGAQTGTLRSALDRSQREADDGGCGGRPKVSAAPALRGKKKKKKMLAYVEGKPALIKQAAGEELGIAPTREELAVEKLLQHVLSMRGLQYDSLTLKSLLLWAQGNDLIPTVERLWEEVSTGSKEVSKFSMVWRLIYETVKEMRAKKGAAASAFAALTPERGSASAMLFAGPSIPLAPVNKKKEGRGTTETASESVAAGSQSEGPPKFSPPPPKAPSPPSLGTPATQTAEERE